MAFLAEHGYSIGQKSIVIAPVRVVAIEAILINRRVLVKVWSSLFSVAFIAELVDGIGANHSVRKLAVWVMTI